MIDYEKINIQQKRQAEWGPFTLDRYRQFFRYFPAGAQNVLDVGCSNGRGGKCLKEINPDLKIVGLDCLKERLNVLPSDTYDRYIYGYSTNIDSEDESYDVIVAGEFIEHLHDFDIEKTFIEFFRVLKFHGRLLLTTPNPDYIRLKLTGKKVTDGSAHLSEHYPKQLKKRL